MRDHLLIYICRCNKNMRRARSSGLSHRRFAEISLSSRQRGRCCCLGAGFWSLGEGCCHCLGCFGRFGINLSLGKKVVLTVSTKLKSLCCPPMKKEFVSNFLGFCSKSMQKFHQFTWNFPSDCCLIHVCWLSDKYKDNTKELKNIQAFLLKLEPIDLAVR